MERLGRWLFNLVAGLSLLLCLATAGIWVRSHIVSDSVLYSTDPSGRIAKRVWVQRGKGYIRIGWQGAYMQPGFRYRRDLLWERDDWLLRERFIFDLFGFSITAGAGNIADTGAIYIPCWMGLFFAGIPAALCWWYCRWVRTQNWSSDRGAIFLTSDAAGGQQLPILPYGTIPRRQHWKFVLRVMLVLGIPIACLALARLAFYLSYPPIPFREMWVWSHDRNGMACLESPHFTLLYEGQSFKYSDRHYDSSGHYLLATVLLHSSRATPQHDNMTSIFVCHARACPVAAADFASSPSAFSA